jgi:hypothetical protein
MSETINLDHITSTREWVDAFYDNWEMQRSCRGYKDEVSKSLNTYVILPVTRGGDRSARHDLFQHVIMELVTSMIPFRFSEGEHGCEVPSSSWEYLQKYVDLLGAEWGAKNNQDVWVFNPETDKINKKIHTACPAS